MKNNDESSTVCWGFSENSPRKLSPLVVNYLLNTPFRTFTLVLCKDLFVQVTSKSIKLCTQNYPAGSTGRVLYLTYPAGSTDRVLYPSRYPAGAAAGSCFLLVSSFFFLLLLATLLRLIASTCLDRFQPNLVTRTPDPWHLCHMTIVGSKVT